MKGFSVHINGEKYPVVFNYKTFKLLGRLWGLPGINDVMQKIAALSDMQKASFDQLDQCGELVLMGIEAAGGDFEGDLDDVVSAIMFDPESRDKFMQELTESFAQDDKKKQTPKSKVNPASRKK